MKPLDHGLVFVCGFIEHIGREYKLERSVVVDTFGEENIRRLYTLADVFHCQSLENNLIDWEERLTFPRGDYATHINAKFRVPSPYAVGKVYARLIQMLEFEPVEGIFQVYHSFLAELICNYNNHVIFTPIQELAQSYREGALIL